MVGVSTPEMAIPTLQQKAGNGILKNLKIWKDHLYVETSTCWLVTYRQVVASLNQITQLRLLTCDTWRLRQEMWEDMW